MKRILILFLVFFAAGYLYSQRDEIPVPTTNIEIINSLLDSSLHKFDDYFILLGKDSFYMISASSGNDAADYLIKYFRQKYPAIKFVGSDRYVKGNVIEFELKNINISTVYIPAGKFQVLRKNITRKINTEFKSDFKRNDTLFYSYSFLKSYEDEFDYSYKNYVESGHYGFVKGYLPDENFWDKFLIPVAAIATSAAAIILFFIIRSK
ncbi:MAG: hypothetical protein JW917_04260 [Ignavibacteria bacterium]|nr:hypothetical protein [Ignavibacteria bacterium]